MSPSVPAVRETLGMTDMMVLPGRHGGTQMGPTASSDEASASVCWPLPLHAREVAGSKPAAPILEGPALRGLSSFGTPVPRTANRLLWPKLGSCDERTDGP